MKEFNEPVMFRGVTTFVTLPVVNGDSIVPLITTPSVANRTVFECINTSPTTITNFLNGSKFQPLKILGDGFTTIANNATIKTNTGANKLLAANKVYNFTLFGSTWIEDAD